MLIDFPQTDRPDFPDGLDPTPTSNNLSVFKVLLEFFMDFTFLL